MPDSNIGPTFQAAKVAVLAGPPGKPARARIDGVELAQLGKLATAIRAVAGQAALLDEPTEHAVDSPLLLAVAGYAVRAGARAVGVLGAHDGRAILRP